jgi:uncharacterized repeat protein (TIGR02543 family)
LATSANVAAGTGIAQGAGIGGGGATTAGSGTATGHAGAGGNITISGNATVTASAGLAGGNGAAIGGGGATTGTPGAGGTISIQGSAVTVIANASTVAAAAIVPFRPFRRSIGTGMNNTGEVNTIATVTIANPARVTANGIIDNPNHQRVTVTDGPNGTTPRGTGSGYFPGNVPVEITPGNPPAGMEFLWWNTSPYMNFLDDGGYYYAHTFFVTPAVAVPVTVWPQWGPVHTITYNANGGTGTMPPTRVRHGFNFVVPNSTFTRPGHYFVGWTLLADGGGMFFEPGETFIDVVQSQVLFAQWASVLVGGQTGDLYTDTPGSATFSVTTANIPTGSTITLNNPNNVPGITMSPATSTASGNTTITINITAATPGGMHPLTITVDGRTSAVFQLSVGVTLYTVNLVTSGTGHSGAGNYAAGTTVNIFAGTPVFGSEFTHWTSAPIAVNFADPYSATTSFTMPSSNIFVTANFAPIQHPVTLHANDGTDDTDARSVTHGTAFTAPASPFTFDEHTFTGWYTAPVRTGDLITVGSSIPNVQAALNLYAQWEVITRAVTIESEATGASGGGAFAAGEVVTVFTGTPEAGRQFVNWTSVPQVDFYNIYDSATTFVMPSTAVIVTANFANLYRTITFNAHGGTGEMDAVQIINATGFILPVLRV